MIEESYKNIAITVGQQLTKIKEISILENGDEIFNSILNSIKQAENYILFETFIFWNGEIAKKISDALIEKSRKGVKCYLLFDGYGCKDLDKSLTEKMQKNGIKISYYNPFTLKGLFTGKSLNHRTHRKILIIDGKTGYIGGVGIADQWLGNANSPSQWRDLHFKLEGAILDQLQSAFFNNWLEYPEEHIKNDMLTLNDLDDNGIDGNVVLSTPMSKYNSLRLQLLEAYQIAKKKIQIMTPYFIPDDQELKIISECAKRGVKVEVIVPGKHIDKKFVRYCSRYYWGRCLKAGVQIFEYEPTFNHSKLIIIDEFWVTIGSLNFDARSLKLNEEANVHVFDKDFAKKMSTVFQKDKTKSIRIDLEKWLSRPLLIKALDFLAARLRKYL